MKNSSKGTIVVLVIALIICIVGWITAAGASNNKTKLAACENITANTADQCAEAIQDQTKMLQGYVKDLAEFKAHASSTSATSSSATSSTSSMSSASSSASSSEATGSAMTK